MTIPNPLINIDDLINGIENRSQIIPIIGNDAITIHQNGNEISFLTALTRSVATEKSIDLTRNNFGVDDFNYVLDKIKDMEETPRQIIARHATLLEPGADTTVLQQ